MLCSAETSVVVLTGPALEIGMAKNRKMWNLARKKEQRTAIAARIRGLVRIIGMFVSSSLFAAVETTGSVGSKAAR
jgi:hypothetical protein